MLQALYKTLYKIEEGINCKCSVEIRKQDCSLVVSVYFVCTLNKKRYEYDWTISSSELNDDYCEETIVNAFIAGINDDIRHEYESAGHQQP